MKIVFLDFDGVLNSIRSFIATSRGSKKWDSLDDMNKDTLDPIGVGLLNRLIRDTDAKIVISSSHRKYFLKNKVLDLSGLRNYFYNFGIEGDIIDATPINYRPYAVRGDEIKEWLENHSEFNIKKYVILDDDSDMLEEQLPHFIHTNSFNGFSFENWIKAMEILTGKEIPTEYKYT
jgi:hypothetical protein